MTTFRSIEELVAHVAEGVRPPERLSVLEAAEKHRRINNPAVWVGPWSRDLTPYMNEVQDVLQSLEHTALVFVGPAQCGKALWVGEEVYSTVGWTTMGALAVGDTIYDENGRPCRVTFATPVMHDHRCYRVKVSDGSVVIADAEHRWTVHHVDGGLQTVTTEELLVGSHRLPAVTTPAGEFIGSRAVLSVIPVPSVPVRCIQVDSPNHLFLVGRAMIPTHNTDVTLNWITHSVIYDPMDSMIIHPTQVAARDYSRRRVDRLHREAKEVKARLVPKRESDSVYYKQYRNGMILNQSWPTISELSGRPIGRLWLTDVDRMTDDVDGEGSPFDLARKRSTTFGRYGMTVAESSPGRVVTNPKWMPKTPHEAPPTTGILALYNRGDRRRWYWRCDHCAQWFEPEFELLTWPENVDIMTAGEAAELACPHCGGMHAPDRKADLNARGVWLRAGQRFDENGEVVGTPIRSDIASFWLKGVAAAFASWQTLVINYLKAEEEYERTGDEGALQTTVNTDQGLPYTPKGMDGDRLPETLKARAADLGEKEVPPGCRFLLASVDVQKNRFEVGVHGVGPGGDIFVVDRFAIRKSERVDDDGDPWPVTPGAYPEDWELLVDRVMEKTYPLGDGTGRRMAVKLTACDSGGVLGVTTRAYEFYRSLKARGLHNRFLLVKGASSKTAPRVQLSYPDSERKDRHAGARGEIPVLMLNTNLLKDQLNALLDREEPYGGMIHFPDWLPDTYYGELTAEVRTEKGWENPRKLRNEAMDLLVYCLALMRSHHIRAEFMDWENPPAWAAEWDSNDMVFGDDDHKPFEQSTSGGYSFSKYAEALA